MGPAGQKTRTKPKDCRMSPIGYHNFTSHITVKDQEGNVVRDQTICSWCTTPKVKL